MLLSNNDKQTKINQENTNKTKENIIKNKKIINEITNKEDFSQIKNSKDTNTVKPIDSKKETTQDVPVRPTPTKKPSTMTRLTRMFSQKDHSKNNNANGNTNSNGNSNTNTPSVTAVISPTASPSPSSLTPQSHTSVFHFPKLPLSNSSSAVPGSQTPNSLATNNSKKIVNNNDIEKLSLNTNVQKLSQKMDGITSPSSASSNSHNSLQHPQPQKPLNSSQKLSNTTSKSSLRDDSSSNVSSPSSDLAPLKNTSNPSQSKQYLTNNNINNNPSVQNLNRNNLLNQLETGSLRSPSGGSSHLTVPPNNNIHGGKNNKLVASSENSNDINSHPPNTLLHSHLAQDLSGYETDASVASRSSACTTASSAGTSAINNSHQQQSKPISSSASLASQSALPISNATNNPSAHASSMHPPSQLSKGSTPAGSNTGSKTNLLSRKTSSAGSTVNHNSTMTMASTSNNNSGFPTTKINDGGNNSGGEKSPGLNGSTVSRSRSGSRSRSQSLVGSIAAAFGAGNKETREQRERKKAAAASSNVSSSVHSGAEDEDKPYHLNVVSEEDVELSDQSISSKASKGSALKLKLKTSGAFHGAGFSGNKSAGGFVPPQPSVAGDVANMPAVPGRAVGGSSLSFLSPSQASLTPSSNISSITDFPGTTSAMQSSTSLFSAGVASKQHSGLTNGSTASSSNLATPIPSTYHLGSVPGSISGSGSGLTNLNPHGKRFVMSEDGRTHEHYLRCAKRQERIGNMIRDLLRRHKEEIPIEGSNLSLLSSYVDQQALAAGKVPSNASISSISTNGTGASPAVTFFEKYGKCQEVIGRGAFGIVRVSHKTDPSNSAREQLYAVKEFKRRPQESEKKYTKRLTSEFCISSSLRHSNIIHTLDLLRDAKGEFCEVMEYCAGGDLYTLILSSGKLEFVEADCFFKQMLRGVVYMHEMGVAHRDMKPENLLLTTRGSIKITDFGNGECFRMAWEKDIHMTNGLCGSAPYIAPEEYKEKQFDPRGVDIWATGVIYMAMRTGRHLWRVARDDDEFYARYLEGRKDEAGYEPIEHLERRCRNVIYSILDPHPTRRITGKQILNSEWGRAITVCESGDRGW